MGKRQHQKDKMYLTYTEWTTLYGGKKSGETSKEEENFKRLPFDHCCLSLQPFEIPYCDLDGNIFELEALLPFLKKYKINPVTGKPLELKALVKLNFHKNSDGEFECPVLFKPFTKSSHIATIATTGNVYLMEAVEQLNIKSRNWKDLITDKPFERKDIIVLQDPNNLLKFNISTFHHVKNNLRVETEDEIFDKSNPQANLKSINAETKYTLEELNKEYKAPTIEINKTQSKAKADKFNAAHYSTGEVAASFTSTAMNRKLDHEAAIMHEDEVRYQRVKKKGYVRLVTNLGMLNLELFCDVVPKTCENFIKHCESGYYNGTKFHRSIRNFMVGIIVSVSSLQYMLLMIQRKQDIALCIRAQLQTFICDDCAETVTMKIQGGDPTNTGNGGKSIWGNKFEDEFRPNLTHTGRGVLSMANSGKNTNGSQFFITFRSCKHLDNKHTIFGKVVGGMETLTEMEKIEVDNKDRPIEDIVLLKAEIFVNPYDEADEQLAKERLEELNRQREEESLEAKKNKSNKELKVFKTGVGKYINPVIAKSFEKDIDVESNNKKRKIVNTFNFNNW